MDIGKGNIIRSICRSLEILLFFVISIVGFNVLVKTTSLNSKSKKSLSGGTLAPRELSVPENSHTLHYGLEHIHRFFSSQPQHASSSFTLQSGIPPFPDILHQQHLFITHSVRDVHNNDHSISSPLLKPVNLFQQNPILLILFFFPISVELFQKRLFNI